jgi:hypothetical protein
LDRVSDDAVAAVAEDAVAAVAEDAVAAVAEDASNFHVFIKDPDFVAGGYYRKV